MLEKKQDSTNSTREFQVGGYDFNNNLFFNWNEQGIHIGHSPTFSLFFGPVESGWGMFGVGQEPNNFTWIGDAGQYKTIVSDGVIQPSSKFTFSGTVSVQDHDFPWESPYVVKAPTTQMGRFISSQYSERHLITSSASTYLGVTTIYFADQFRRNNEFYIAPCDARAYRLLANVNGIQRTSGTQSRSFSAYWDVAFGIRNGNGCGSTFSFIGSPSFFNHMMRSSFISTGNLSLAVGATPSLTISLGSDGAVDTFQILVDINGTYSMIGSAKLTEVETGSIVTGWTFPT